MIKNIVFDMGNVLVDYIADGVCRHFIEDQETRKKVSTSIFVSPEWILLDLGVMPEDIDVYKRQAQAAGGKHCGGAGRLQPEKRHDTHGNSEYG